MYKLFLDTTTKFLCLGITNDDQVLYEYQELAEKKQSELTIPLIEKALKSVQLQLKDIQEIIVTIGPGSFTGIRIGMCIAKTLASFNHIPLKAISSLNSYASFEKSIVVLDAKAHRCYFGIYNQHKNMINDCVISLEEANQLIEQYPDYKIVLDGHLLKKDDVYPPHILQNMMEISKQTEPIASVDNLIPVYLKDSVYDC